MISKGLSIGLFLIMVFSCEKNKNYYDVPLYSSNDHVNAVIEIPSGTNKKFEFDKQSNSFIIDKENGNDRVINFLPYPGNYGFIPSTYSDPEKGGDGDALDVLIISENTEKGNIIEIVPIAILKLIDKGEIDYKIIAVPADTKKRIIDAVNFKSFSKDYPIIKQIIELWFLNYNKADKADIEGWGDEIEAMAEIIKNKIKV